MRRRGVGEERLAGSWWLGTINMRYSGAMYPEEENARPGLPSGARREQVGILSRQHQRIPQRLHML